MGYRILDFRQRTLRRVVPEADFPVLHGKNFDAVQSFEGRVQVLCNRRFIQTGDFDRGLHELAGRSVLFLVHKASFGSRVSSGLFLP